MACRIVSRPAPFRGEFDLPGLLESLIAPRPALWLEVSPPRGIDPAPLVKRLEAVRGMVDAINLTDNSLGNARMSGLVFASIFKAQLGFAAVLNFSCRDRNRLALKSDLLGAGALGVEGVVAVGGDPIGQSAGGPPRVGDLKPVELIEMIVRLNHGDTGDGKRPLGKLPAILPGAVANPNRLPVGREIELLECKARAGARFVITQPIFDAETAGVFLAHARRLKIEVMLGILPIKRAEMATYLKERIRDLKAVAGYFDQLARMSEERVREVSLADSLALMRKLAGEVAGFIVMSGGGPSLAIDLALEFDRLRKGFMNRSDST